MIPTRAAALSRLLLVGLCTVALPLAAASAAERSQSRSITVSASATVAAEPDIALISTGVVTEAATAREALDANTVAMKRLIEGLKTAGIEARDIQTTAFNIHPRYEDTSRSSSSPRQPKAPSIVGYRVHNEVRITARDIGRLGEVLDEAVTLGANQIDSIAFHVSKAETLKDEARREAIANARRRAELFASAAGVELGRVIRIEEIEQDGPRPLGYARAMKAEAVPIERGTEMLEATVRVTWELE